jgi:hypothetical protein
MKMYKIHRTSLIEIIVNLTKTKICSNVFKDLSRKKETDFTRKRKMIFEEVILFMLLSLKCSTQSALRRFFTAIGKTVIMKQQSFSEARAKIKVSAFIELFKLTAAAMVEHCRLTWHGYRILAIDGSKITLPSDEDIRDYYHSLGKAGSAPTAQASILYDVQNDIVIDAQIEPLSVDERTLAKEHIDNCKELLPDEKKLIIFDRGYPSFDLIEKLTNNEFHFVMRVKSKFNKDIDAQTTPDGYVWLEKDAKRIHIRVVKFQLDNGEIETLITNIEDRRLGKNAFKNLYFMRWPVETKYDTVKNKLQIENFSSRTVEGIQQDFFAAMYLTNVVAAAAIDAEAEIHATRMEKNNKYQYHANINELIGVLKDRLVLAITEKSSSKQAEAIQNIIDEIKLYVAPKRNNRSIARKPPRKAKFHHNHKVNC